MQENLLYQAPVDSDQLNACWGTTIEVQQVETFQLIAYMDDVAVPVIAAKPVDTLHMIQHLFEMALSVFQRFRFSLNFALGKGNAIARIVGPGAELVRLALQLNAFNISCKSVGTESSKSLWSMRTNISDASRLQTSVFDLTARHEPSSARQP